MTCFVKGFILKYVLVYDTHGGTMLEFHIQDDMEVEGNPADYVGVKPNNE